MTSVQKISNTLGISTATFLNWKKAGLIPKIPAIDDEDSYKKYIHQIKKNVEKKLSSRANRSLSTEKFVVYQGIKTKERKQLLLNLIDKFKKSSVSNEEGIISLIICQLRRDRKSVV